MRGSRKTVNGAYRYRYAPFLVPIYDALALPLGELSPQVTERTLRPRDVICLRRCQHFPIGRCRYLPSPSSLRSATSPTGRGKEVPGRKPFTTIRLSGGTRIEGSRKTVNGAYRYRYAPFLVPIYDALALPLGELSPQVTERTLRPRDVICLRRCQHFPIGRCRYLPSPSSLRSATSPTGRGKGVPGRKPFTTIRLSGGTRIEGSRKTVNGAYRYRYAPFLVPIYDALALPLGELSPQVTERALRPRDVICLRRCQHFPIGRCRYLPSPSSLRSATSPTGRGKGVPGRKPFTTIRLSGGTRIEG